MRKVLLSFAAALSVAGIHQSVQAQAPARFNYQGIARMANGNPMVSQAISMRISILDGSTSGATVYQETHNATTNAYGLYNVTIGGGTPVIGTLGGVNFANGSKFIQVELDPTGGTTYTNLGATQLLSVPYAMHSASAASAPAPTLTLTGNSLSAGGNSVTLPGGSSLSGTQNYVSKFATASTLGNSQIFDNGTSIGINNTTPSAKLHITPGSADSMGLRVTSNYTGSLGFGLIRVEYTGTNSTTNKAGITSVVVPSTTAVNGTGIFAAGGFSGIQSRGLANTGVGDVYGLISDAYSEDTAFGVYGLADTYTSPTPLGQKYGVAGLAFGGSTNYGIFGIAGQGTTNWAGYFSGNVNVTGTIAKAGGTFKIDHPKDPENKYLYHSFVESPDMMNIYNGNVVTDAQGNATVTLPDYFDALNKEFRYQLTPIGTFAQAIIAEEIAGNSFVVKTDKPGVKVSWQVTGVRKDKWAEAHRVQPEVAKPESERGKYIHAAEWGKQPSEAIDQSFAPARKRGEAPGTSPK